METAINIITLMQYLCFSFCAGVILASIGGVDRRNKKIRDLSFLSSFCAMIGLYLINVVLNWMFLNSLSASWMAALGSYEWWLVGTVAVALLFLLPWLKGHWSPSSSPDSSVFDNWY